MASVNVEKIVIGWLDANVGSGWNVYGDQPKDRSEKYILVDRTGGERDYLVLDKAELLIEIYHKTSRVDASDKAQDIVDLLPHLAAIEAITSAKVNSLVRLDDLIGQYFRYQIYLRINARREILDVPIEYPVVVDPDDYDKTFVYEFVNQSTIIVTHNLNKYPSVRVEDSAGDDVECDITYNSLNQLTLTASGSFSGVVYCN